MMEVIFILSLVVCLAVLCCYAPRVGLALIMAPGLVWLVLMANVIFHIGP